MNQSFFSSLVRGTSISSSVTKDWLIGQLDGHYKGFCGFMLVVKAIRESNWQDSKLPIFEEDS